MYEDEEPYDDELDPEVPREDDGDANRRGEEEEENVVISGDPSAAANRTKSTTKTEKDMKIPNEDRQTTPYMTKYERARILGTRALQIR